MGRERRRMGVYMLEELRRHIKGEKLQAAISWEQLATMA